MRIVLCIILIFTFWNSILATTDVENPSTEAQMLITAQGILNDLKQAKGILAHEPPILTRVYTFRGAGKLASMYLDKGEIHLDTRTYQICRSMGRDSLNALAFLLGHELGHFIHKHGGINHNIQDAAPGAMKSLPVSDVVNAEAENRRSGFELRLQQALEEYEDTHDEAEADFEGAFLGYLAGYETMEAGKVFLTEAYQRLGIDTLASGYPTLSERLAIVNKTTEELEQLTPIFELSKYLVAIGQYADAIPLLEKILEKFQSPEIYNNLGVLQLLHIQTLFKEPLTKYKLPLTLDAEFRAPHPQSFERVRIIPGGHSLIGDWEPDQLPPTQACQLNQTQKRIEIAETYFEKSIQLNRDYILAYLNLSIAHTIKTILFDPEYNKNLNSEIVQTICKQRQREELINAKSNIGIALQKCQKALFGNCIEYFQQPPSDTIQLVSYPPDEQIDAHWKYAPSLASDLEGDQIKRIYPEFIECFDTISFSVQSPGEPIKFTRWTTPNYKIPRAGYLLSNIFVQLDLIHLLDPDRKNDKISYAYPYPRKMVNKAPFERALEINPNNQLAKFNYSKYHGATSSPQADSSNCTLLEKYNDKTLLEHLNEINNWNYTTAVSKSRIMPYFKSRAVIEEADFNTVQRKLFNTTQEVQYAQMDGYRIYVNNSTSENGVTDKSIFLVPDSFETKKTACGLSYLSIQDEIETIYGHPSKVLQTSQGQLITIELNRTKDHTQLEIDPDDWPPPSQSVINQIKETEEGLIFQSNTNNQINGWVLYLRNTITRPYLEN